MNKRTVWMATAILTTLPFLFMAKTNAGTDGKKDIVIPQNLTDAMTKVLQDKSAISSADEAITAATTKKNEASSALATDYATLTAIWNEVFGTNPPGPAPITIPEITSSLIVSAVSGQAFNYQITATNTPVAYGATGLPDGLVVNQATGAISGIPKSAAVSNVQLSATNISGTGTAILQLSVAEPSNPVLAKVRLLISYDDSQLSSMPESQREIVFSDQPGSLKAWANEHCLVDANNVSEWRCLRVAATADGGPDWLAPLVQVASNKPGITIQIGEAGAINRVDLPDTNESAVAAAVKLSQVVGAKSIKKVKVIDDTNYRQFIGQRPTGYIKGPPLVGLKKFRDAYPIIPRSQWKQLVLEGKGSFLSDLCKSSKIPAKNQGNLGYCWAYASVECVETIRALQGQPFVSLSPESVGGPVTGWRNQGGWGTQALEQLENVGCCATSYMDSANSLSYRRWGSAWKDDCANHKVTGAWASIDDGGFDAVFTATLLRMPVSIGLDWWGHQVQVLDPVVFDDGSYGVLFRNSWGSDWGDDGYSTLTESKSQPSGSFAAVSVVASDKDINEKSRGTIVDLVRLRQKSVKKQIDRNSANLQLAN